VNLLLSLLVKEF